jgi:hypothetical protein
MKSTKIRHLCYSNRRSLPEDFLLLLGNVISPSGEDHQIWPLGVFYVCALPQVGHMCTKINLSSYGERLFQRKKSEHQNWPLEVILDWIERADVEIHKLNT